uniref:Uncharacterized protein n=1 Tax=Haptolina ericina TaxID=156174 RepID=A0A7S3C4R2_9EUKA
MASRIAKQRQERSAMRTPGRDAVMISTWPEALPLARGCRAVVGGLEKRSDLNGLAVDVESDETDGRYTVRCDGSGECVRVRSINLQVTAGWPSSWPSLAGQRLTEEAASSLCLAMVRGLDLSREAWICVEELGVIGGCCVRLEWFQLAPDCQALPGAEGLGWLTELPELRSLSLRDCIAVDDAGVCALATAPYGYARRRSNMGDRGHLAAVAIGLGASCGCRVLEELDLGGCVGVRDEGVAALAGAVW